MTFDWADIVEREGAALADTAVVDPATRVPAAPAWDTTELRGHAGLIRDLLLWLRGRVALDQLELFGNRAAAEALRGVTTL